MKAARAAALSKEAEDHLKSEKWKRREQEDEARAQRVTKILPELITSAMAQIRQAVREGRTYTTIDAGEESQGAVAHALQQEGYQVSTGSERNNYGDSAAPCMQTDYWIKVSWR